MGDRVYDILLSCGCMVSLDAGGGLMSCYKPPNECKFQEEYMNSPNFEKWERKILL